MISIRGIKIWSLGVQRNIHLIYSGRTWSDLLCLVRYLSTRPAMQAVTESVRLSSVVDIPCLSGVSGEFQFLIGSSESRYSEGQTALRLLFACRTRYDGHGDFGDLLYGSHRLLVRGGLASSRL